jgi:hypothetical protein
MGLTAFIVNIDDHKTWELDIADPDSSLVRKYFEKDKNDIRIDDYIGSILNHGVVKQNIYFVYGGSETQSEKKIMAEITERGYSILHFDDEKEIQWAFKATVPKQYERGAFFVKISPDRIVIAWLEDQTVLYKELRGAPNDRRIKEIQDMAKNVPTNKRGYCFIAGDVPAKMAEKHRTGNERFTVLDRPDSYNFTEEQYQNTVKFYRAIYETSICNTFVYDWSTNFVIGRLLNE